MRQLLSLLFLYFSRSVQIVSPCTTSSPSLVISLSRKPAGHLVNLHLNLPDPWALQNLNPNSLQFWHPEKSHIYSGCELKVVVLLMIRDHEMP